MGVRTKPKRFPDKARPQGASPRMRPGISPRARQGRGKPHGGQRPEMRGELVLVIPRGTQSPGHRVVGWAPVADSAPGHSSQDTGGARHAPQHQSCLAPTPGPLWPGPWVGGVALLCSLSGGRRGVSGTLRAGLGPRQGDSKGPSRCPCDDVPGSPRQGGSIQDHRPPTWRLPARSAEGGGEGALHLQVRP